MKRIFLQILIAAIFVGCSSDDSFNSGNSGDNGNNNNNTNNGNHGSAWIDCSFCNKSGKCFYCKGDGWWLADEKRCPYCDGTGICDECDGLGKWYYKW